MTLSARQADLIAESYARIARMQKDYSTLFYHRLFERHPFARSLFPDDMAHQVSVFRKTLDALVAGVDDLASLRPTLVALAKRHVHYGVTAQQYGFVGEVLIDTLAEMSDSGFTAETRAAWDTLYAETARIMVGAAHPPK